MAPKVGEKEIARANVDGSNQLDGHILKVAREAKRVALKVVKRESMVGGRKLRAVEAMRALRSHSSSLGSSPWRLSRRTTSGLH